MIIISQQNGKTEMKNKGGKNRVIFIMFNDMKNKKAITCSFSVLIIQAKGLDNIDKSWPLFKA